MKERSVSIQDTIRREFRQLAPGLILFAEVVEAGSITRAADRLGVGKSMVSKSLAGLEAKLGVLLLERTTRVQKLTAAGDQLYHSVSRMISEGEMALADIDSWKVTPAGKLRLTIAELACQFLATSITAFKRNYPLVEIDITIDDAQLDLTATQLDLGIRFGWPNEQNIVVRNLYDQAIILVASPSYLDRSQPITEPSDLTLHDWVLHPADPLVSDDGMLLKGPDNSEAKLQLRRSVTTNSAIYIKNLILAGAGIALYPLANVERELASGALVQLVPEWKLPSASVYAAYTHRNALSSIARLFLDKLIEDSRSAQPSARFG
jgi:DNA-binding transcriptional LysR family regulator